MTTIAALLTLLLPLLPGDQMCMAPPPHQVRSALERRGNLLSGQTSSEPQANGRYLLENNLWAQNTASSGSQTTQATANNGNSVSWYTNYTWVGGTNVKSYANLDLKQGINKNLSSIASIPVSWSWSYASASSNLMANTAFDLWLSGRNGSSGASSSTSYEIMVWLGARGGARPVGALMSSTVSINGMTWKLYKGTVKTWTIYTFQSPSDIQNYNSDLKPFFNYLSGKYAVPVAHFLVQVQGGTEAYTGSAKFVTSSQTMTVN